MYAEGKPQRQIATELRKTHQAIYHYSSRACQRLGVSSVFEAVLVCHEKRWVEIKVRKKLSAQEPPLTQIQRDYVRSFTALIQHSPTARDRLVRGLIERGAMKNNQRQHTSD
jgi:hypothetical protein